MGIKLLVLILGTVRITAAAEPVSLTPREVFEADRRVLDVQYEAAKKNAQLNRPAALRPEDRAALTRMREFVVTKPMIQSARKTEKESAEIQKKKIETSPAYLKIKRDLEAQKAIRPARVKNEETAPGTLQKNDAVSKTPIPVLKHEPREEVVIDGLGVPKEIEFQKSSESQ